MFSGLYYRGVGILSNWAAYKESEIGLPVVKRALHGIHFDKGKGEVLAEFCGKPCHWFDGKLWQAIDTKPLLRKDGSYGCPHSDVVILPDGTVQVGEYAQKAALIYPGKMSIDGDRIARPFSGGVQYLYITENGFRQEIVLEKMPDLKKVASLVDTVSGVLPSKYTASVISLKDSSTAELSDSVQVDKTSLASVLEAAKYPVTIDPDFAASANDGSIRGYTTAPSYSTARSTSVEFLTGGASNYVQIGQDTYGTDGFSVNRGFVLFDTSSIGAGSTVTQANLKMHIQNVSYVSGDFDIQIVKQDWSAFAADVSNATNRETAYDGCLSGTADDSILGTASTIGTGLETSGNLSTAWVSKTGTTYYSLRSSRDLNADQPTGDEFVTFGTSENTNEARRPVFTVLYTAASGNPYYYFRQQQ